MKTATRTMLDCYESGRVAARKELPFSTNPWPPGPESAWWYRGWMDQHNLLREMEDEAQALAACQKSDTERA